jgi:hypothetical protein
MQRTISIESHTVRYNSFSARTTYGFLVPHPLDMFFHASHDDALHSAQARERIQGPEWDHNSFYGRAKLFVGYSMLSLGRAQPKLI